MAILTLIATTGDNARASFLVHQVPRALATFWQYHRMFTQFSLRVTEGGGSESETSSSMGIVIQHVITVLSELAGLNNANVKCQFIFAADTFQVYHVHDRTAAHFTGHRDIQ